MPATRRTSSAGPSGPYAPQLTRDWVKNQAALAVLEENDLESAFRRWADVKGRNSSWRGLLKSTSFRLRVRQGLLDEDLPDEPIGKGHRVIFGAAVQLGLELQREIDDLREKVTFFELFLS